MNGSSSPKRPLDATARSESAEKRRRLSRPSYDEPSDSALLYHNARAAHIASAALLQHAFLPQSVQIVNDPDVQAFPAYATGKAFMHDPHASAKVLALQIYALDCLKIGLKSGMLSIGEKAAFTVEFATIGIKVLESQAGHKLEGRDRIQRDIVAAVTELINVELNPQMAEWKRHLEWLNVKLAFMTERHNAAKRYVKQYSRSPKSYYALSFLQLQYSSEADNLPLLAEMMERAGTDNDMRMTQLLALIYTRSLYTLRKWDLVPTALHRLGTSLGWDETSYSANGPSSGDALARHTYFVLHYILLRCLWEGRIGHDLGVRALLKRLYLIVDEICDADRFGTIRTQGAILDIGSHGMRVQTTHANVLFLTTFLVTVTSRRDYIGKDANCKSLLYAQALTEYAQVAKMDDIWDTGFNPLHELGNVESLRAEVYSTQAEALLEEATTCMFRSNFEQANSATWRATRMIQQHHMQALLPHLCVVHAQLAQLLGVDKLAIRYYEAALKMMVPGNELGLMVQASILGTRGTFEHVQENHQMVSHINALGEKCKSSSSALLQIVGGVLLSVTEGNHHLAKRKISSTYDLCQTSNNNVIRGLIFAFTSTTLLTGSDERIAKQLETGLEISSLLGGKDREDKVGQTVLGLWFALRLRSHHNRRRDMGQLAIARSLAQRHQHRLNEIVEYAEKRYGADQIGLLGQLRAVTRPEP